MTKIRGVQTKSHKNPNATQLGLPEPYLDPIRIRPRPWQDKIWFHYRIWFFMLFFFLHVHTREKEIQINNLHFSKHNPNRLNYLLKTIFHAF